MCGIFLSNKSHATKKEDIRPWHVFEAPVSTCASKNSQGFALLEVDSLGLGSSHSACAESSCRGCRLPPLPPPPPPPSLPSSLAEGILHLLGTNNCLPGFRREGICPPGDSWEHVETILRTLNGDPGWAPGCGQTSNNARDSPRPPNQER